MRLDPCAGTSVLGIAGSRVFLYACLLFIVPVYQARAFNRHLSFPSPCLTPESWEQAGGCVPQGSKALPVAAHWPGPGLEMAMSLSPPPTLRPNGSGHPQRMQSVGRAPHCLGSLRSLKASWGLGAWPPQ